MIALLSATGTSVGSMINKTSCDHMPNAASCEQNTWHQSGRLAMLCGLTTQYGICEQLCVTTSQCNVLECRALDRCKQLCWENYYCGSMTCDSKECDQSCYDVQNICKSMMCPKTAKKCKQKTASEMTCEADACEQTCDRGSHECQMTCPVGGNTCTQVGLVGSASDMRCDRGVCDQHCNIGGRCNMNCSSSVTTGRCKQMCAFAKCDSMICNATNCTQDCFFGECNMACPIGVKNCIQEANKKNTTMRCNGEVCRQVCGTGNCTMSCSANVKECHQICREGTECLYKCDAENCAVEDCSEPSSCTTVKPPVTVSSNATNLTTTSTTSKIVRSAIVPLEIGSSVLGGLILALIEW